MITYFAPLCFVLAVTIGKEAWDDRKRYLRDREANSQIYERLTDRGFQNIPAFDIKIGDMIRIHQNQRVSLKILVKVLLFLEKIIK